MYKVVTKNAAKNVIVSNATHKGIRAKCKRHRFYPQKDSYTQGKKYEYWEARVSTGVDPGTGKHIQRSITGRTQREVTQKLREVSYEMDQGTYPQGFLWWTIQDIEYVLLKPIIEVEKEHGPD